MIHQSSSQAGQAVYNRRNLKLYDALVLHASNRWLWRCPLAQLREHYQHHLSNNHLDVGVGSGYFPDRCVFPAARPRLALLDLNADALAYASHRLQRYSPECHQADIMQPLEIATPSFDSIGLHYLLHCLPRPMSRKAQVFDHLRPLMATDAVLFGATILATGVPRSTAAKKVMAIYNRRGIFDNHEDSRSDLEQALESRFARVSIEITGCVARFSAAEPHKTALSS